MKTQSRKLCAILAVLAMTACSVYKPYSRPADMETDGLFGDAVSVSDTLSLSDLSWQEFFCDKYLQALITKGLEHNADMQIASQRVISAEAALKSARLAFLPQFSFAPSVNSETSKRYQPTQVGYQIGVHASWEIALAGGMLSAKRKAKANLEYAQLYRRSVQTRVVAAIANSYYTLLMLDAQLAVSRRTAASWKENVHTMKLMKRAGMTNEASISRTEANSCSIDASLFDLECRITHVENALSLLVGVLPVHHERGSIYDQSISHRIRTGVPAQLLSRRPDVQAAEANLKVAYYNTAAARAMLYPSLTISGDGGWADAITNPASWFVSLGAKLLQPIFQGGRNRAALKIAQAQQQQALIEFKHALLRAGSEVNDALSQCKAANGKRELRKQQIAALESAVSSTQKLMSHSESTYLEVLTAQQALLSAQLQQISDQFDAIQGMVILYEALGGGAGEPEPQQPQQRKRRRERRTSR